jgi:hypothetical protein
VASPATARLACEGGLDFLDIALHLKAGMCASLQTLATLRDLGMPLSTSVLEACAHSGRLNVLQYVLSEQPELATYKKPYYEVYVSYHTAHSGSIEMLNWLRTQSWCHFDEITCLGAAEGGQLAAL